MAEAETRRPGRNEPCHCGSGKKYKACHLTSDEEADRAARAQQAATAAPPPAAKAEAEDANAQRSTPPPRTAGQPWKRGAGAHVARRITTPRKAG
jgi:hypothetical protein